MENGKVIDSWDWLIDPEDYFDYFNMMVHEIAPESVEGKPTFPEKYDTLCKILSNNVVVHHTAFDKIAINAACKKYGLKTLQVNWIDSARVVRRVYKKFRHRGYGLSSLSKYFNIKFKHHDAIEDARAAGIVFYNCLIDSATTVGLWHEEQFRKTGSSKTIGGATEGFRPSEGNPDGFLYGQTCVFTGTLSFTRKEAALIANSVGISVEQNVKDNTTMLVVGLQDDYKLAGHKKSRKQRVAEEKILKGYDIKILSEADFISLVEENKRD